MKGVEGGSWNVETRKECGDKRGTRWPRRRKKLGNREGGEHLATRYEFTSFFFHGESSGREGGGGGGGGDAWLFAIDIWWEARRMLDERCYSRGRASRE